MRRFPGAAVKHQSIWLASLLLVGTPLCAMAFDYGPASPVLAAESGAQRLPLPAAAGNDTTRPETTDDDTADSDATNAAPGAQRTAPSAASTRPAARGGEPVARNKAPAQPPAHPAAPSNATSWQSLLPGSIQ